MFFLFFFFCFFVKYDQIGAACKPNEKIEARFCSSLYICDLIFLQEIDDLLAGGLTQQDEEDVLNELDSIMKVMNKFVRICYMIVK